MHPRRRHGSGKQINFAKFIEPLTLWLEDAFTFLPWEEVSSFELAPTSLFVFTKENVVRKLLIRLIRWKFFDHFMLLVILANSVTLAMASNKPGLKSQSLG
ncbi:hypothetical protein CEUSTIGMA_g4447.t1 [Chlamydomonas eustigma]|uniref:Ion transport domain-containing protein n=1 Tax=Chlamydomonas eustigma TaxID=1157962 RepID=A0A250X2M0_9CHLO|nr:hypothetical protein CEUSTIGMA_g4447.t1 [Chlamydomonas eustigma]|eukprot:GAX77000.1 hypothetical protein CEUSTIGMA_g4447.t1 [Chlamydomonas eustigma]